MGKKSGIYHRNILSKTCRIEKSLCLKKDTLRDLIGRPGIEDEEREVCKTKKRSDWRHSKMSKEKNGGNSQEDSEGMNFLRVFCLCSIWRFLEHEMKTVMEHK